MTALFLFSFNVKTIHSVLGKTWTGVREVNFILVKNMMFPAGSSLLVFDEENH